MSFLEKFEYCPSGISCKTPWTIGQLAGQRLKCYETALKAGGFVVFFFFCVIKKKKSVFIARCPGTKYSKQTKLCGFAAWEHARVAPRSDSVTSSSYRSPSVFYAFAAKNRS